jgi:hypothetical protein
MVVTIPASAIDIVLTFDPLAPEAGVNNWSEGNFQDAGVQVGGQLQLRRRRKP